MSGIPNTPIKKIMAIDDEPSVLKCLQRALESRGYGISTSDDSQKGLEILISDDTIILALLDVKMPGMSGFDIYRELRRVRKIPILFVTAYPKSFNAEFDSVISMWKDEFADGTTDIIYKPFNLTSLYEKVESLIGPAIESEGE